MPISLGDMSPSNDSVRVVGTLAVQPYPSKANGTPNCSHPDGDVQPNTYRLCFVTRGSDAIPGATPVLPLAATLPSTRRTGAPPAALIDAFSPTTGPPRRHPWSATATQDTDPYYRLPSSQKRSFHCRSTSLALSAHSCRRWICSSRTLDNRRSLLRVLVDRSCSWAR